MESIIKALESLIPFLEPYDNWVKWLVSGWIVITAFMIITFLFANKNSVSSMPISETKKWSLTGDSVIDGVLNNLNILESKGKEEISQSELISTLNPLFSRPAFYGIREESFRYFLYPLCKSRLILEHYVSYFELPAIRDSIHNAIQLMVQLQNDVSQFYGPAFSITAHISKYIQSRSDFTKYLPNMVTEPSYQFYDDRDVTIRKIRDTLHPLGLIN